MVRPAPALPDTRNGTVVRLHAHGFAAQVATLGAALVSLQYQGRALVRAFDPTAERPVFAGAILAPWPNRVIDGRYHWDGHEQQLQITEAQRGHALHGLVTDSNFELLSHGEDFAQLGTVIEQAEGYPHRIQLSINYRLEAEGLRVKVSASNLGDSTAPFGWGSHAYLTAPGNTVDDWIFTLPAGRVQLTEGERLLPQEVVDVASTDLDFRSPRVVGELFIDHAYTQLTENAAGVYRAELTDAQGVGAHFTWDQTCPWVQIHTADRDEPELHRTGLAIEPMTCPPGAFNSGQDVISLAPGESHEASWLIGPIQPENNAANQANHRVHNLADGREAIFFADAGNTPPEQIHDERALDPRGEPGQLRYDRLTGDWVAVAAHRQSRTYLPPADQCPLCPSINGRHSEIPAEDFNVVVFENRFPSLGPALGQIPAAAPVQVPAPAYGRCEVVVFTPDHTGSFASLDDTRARTVVEAWAQRTKQLSAMEGIAQVFPFENRGQDIGVTLHHPHGQIYAYSYLTPTATKMAAQAVAHLEKTGRPLLGDILEFERAEGTRMVVQGEHFSVFVPYAARWPLEAHLVPHRHVPDFAALTEVEKDELAVMYRDLLRRFDGLYETPTPYIAAWHQAPLDPTARAASRLHLQLTSPRRAEDKLKFLAGSEAAMGAFINDVPAEQTAARLREVTL